MSIWIYEYMLELGTPWSTQLWVGKHTQLRVALMFGMHCSILIGHSIWATLNLDIVNWVFYLFSKWVVLIYSTAIVNIQAEGYTPNSANLYSSLVLFICSYSHANRISWAENEAKWTLNRLSAWEQSVERSEGRGIIGLSVSEVRLFAARMQSRVPVGWSSQAARQCLAVLIASAVVVLKHEKSTFRQSHNFISIDFKFGVG